MGPALSELRIRVVTLHERSGRREFDVLAWEVEADGCRLSDPEEDPIDLRELHQTLTKDGEFWPINCTCGIASCGRAGAPVVSRRGSGVVEWVVPPGPASGFPERLVGRTHRFAASAYDAAIRQALEETVRQLPVVLTGVTQPGDADRTVSPPDTVRWLMSLDLGAEFRGGPH